MKAAVCRAFKTPLSIEEVRLAEPGPGEVKVRIAACAICHSDILAMEGAWGGELPVVLGHEAAGIVEAIGDGVTQVAAGDHVVVTLVRSCGHCHFCARGERPLCETRLPLDLRSPLRAPDGSPIRQGLRTAAFAEQVVVHASQVAAIPREVPLESASLLACGVITGLGAVLNTAAMRPGGHVATIGTGGVGLNCVQGAAHRRRPQQHRDRPVGPQARGRAHAWARAMRSTPARRTSRAAVRSPDRRARCGLRLRRRGQRCGHRAGGEAACAAAARWWSSA